MARQTMTTTRMPARPGRRTTDHGPRSERTADGRGGFTLVELLVVIVVLAILIALLLPAINGAMRTARNGAVSAEISQLAQALADFKAKYGDYPPSRFLAVENGNYSGYLGNTQSLSASDPSSPGTGDITLGQLAQRSVTILRKFWPRASTNGGVFYDFNGNNNNDGAYILHGHECLVFFLGGVPLMDASTSTYSLTGFGKDPTNPFTNMVVGSSVYSASRQPPLYTFNPGRLFLDPNSSSGIPGYYDTLNNGPPQTGLGSLNFYAYFSSYGNGNYDPNDVNFAESDGSGNGPIGLKFLATFPTMPLTQTPPYVADSPSPNPYTSSTTVPTTTGTVGYQNAQTFQIISAGVDGLYGVGGQYVAPSQTSSASTPLPFDSNNTYSGASLSAESDTSLRQREYDNLTNFKSGTLQ